MAVRISTATYVGRARVVKSDSDEDTLARRLLLAKYEPEERDLADWAKTALPVAVDLMSQES